MIPVGPGRASTGCGGWQCVKGIGQRHHIHGRQEKSAASGRAQVVGWVGTFGQAGIPSSWRFTAKGERLQDAKRHRTPLQKAAAP